MVGVTTSQGFFQSLHAGIGVMFADRKDSHVYASRILSSRMGQLHLSSLTAVPPWLEGGV